MKCINFPWLYFLSQQDLIFFIKKYTILIRKQIGGKLWRPKKRENDEPLEEDKAISLSSPTSNYTPPFLPHIHKTLSMALMQHYSPIKQIRRVYNTQSDSDRKENSGKVRIPPELRSPAEQLAPLANTFQRRLLLGLGTASVVALGANFTGVTSFLLGLSPEIGRNLKLDVIYPIRGYNRCIDTDEGFG